LYLLLRICSCTSTKDIRHLIKLSFNTPKPTRGLDALSNDLSSFVISERDLFRGKGCNTPGVAVADTVHL
jgi:hypothetical protein